MTHLSREPREPLTTYRVYSDDQETFYGRVQRDQLGRWHALGLDVPPFKERARAVSAVVEAVS